MAEVKRFGRSQVPTRDLLWTLLLQLGGPNVKITRCPPNGTERDLLYSILLATQAGSGSGGPIPDGSITEAKFAPGAVSPIVSTTKKTGLGVSSDGEATFDSKGRIIAVTEAAP